MASGKKSAIKSIPSAPAVTITKTGGVLRRGSKKGNTPGTGRPPDKFKELCRKLACDGAELLPTILRDTNHPAYMSALKWASEHGYGKPKETMAIEVSVKLSERMARARARVASDRSDD